MIQRSIHDKEIALDLTQQTFLQAFRARGRYKAKAPPQVWLRKIGLNVVISHIRREKSSRNYVNTYRHEFTTLPDNRSDARIMLSKAMRFLNKEQREVIDLHYFQDLSDEMIAKKLGTSYTTIYRKRIQAIQIMRDRLGVIV